MDRGDFSELTLKEALVEFRRTEGLIEKYVGMRHEAQIQYERHDIVHVLFGLDTSLRQEAMADGWTLFGTDIGLDDIKDFFSLPEEKELVREIGYLKIARTFLRALPDLIYIAWRARKLRKKWHWSRNADYRDMQVGKIRGEFGIPA